MKSRNQNIFEKFKLNRNLQRIPFKMMYNISMLRHRFSNERWGGGGGGALNHLPLLFCKSMFSNYLDTQTLGFSWFLPFSIVFIVSVQTAENDMKTIRKRRVDAIQSLRFH